MRPMAYHLIIAITLIDLPSVRKHRSGPETGFGELGRIKELEKWFSR
jgi:hypothetical protein